MVEIWYVNENDLVGGWAVGTRSGKASANRQYGDVADLMTFERAREVVTLHLLLSERVTAAPTTCPFCERIRRGEHGTTDVEDVVCFEPLNPVTPGHLLFVPKEHGGGNLKENPHETAAAVRAAALYARVSMPEDVNLIVSCGPSATQTVEHVHVHLVPRRPGDGLALPWTGQRRRT